MNALKKQVLTVLLLLAASSAFGQEIPEHYHPVRPMAMGGAFTAIANDENAVWTNPAGVSRIRKARSRSVVNLIKFPNAVVGANASGQAFSKLMQTNTDDTASSIAENAEELQAKPFWAMGGAFPMMMFDFGRQFAAVTGGFAHTTLKAAVDTEDPLISSTQVISDVGGVASFSLTNKSNRLNFGFQLRTIGRYAYEDVVATTDLIDTAVMQEKLKNDSNRSAALGVDLGFMWTLGDFWYPTVGISVLNAPLGCKEEYLNPFSKQRETVCGTKFTGSFANPDAISTIDPTDIRIGFSITPRLGRKIGLRIAADIHHFHVASGENNYGLSEIPILKKIHAGVELFTGNPLTPSPISVSMGMSQGYYTMGAALRLSFLSLDIATFGRDISTTESPQEDRRIMGGLSIDF